MPKIVQKLAPAPPTGLYSPVASLSTLKSVCPPKNTITKPPAINVSVH